MEKDIPTQLDDLTKRALATNPTQDIKTRIANLQNEIDTAIRAKNVESAKTSLNSLETITETLEQSYKLRIYNGPKEDTGFFRYVDGNSNVKNYYIVVEPINDSGDIPVSYTHLTLPTILLV